jgi:hypothetical protein
MTRKQKKSQLKSERNNNPSLDKIPNSTVGISYAGAYLRNFSTLGVATRSEKIFF